MAHEKNTRKKGGVGKILLVLVVLLALAVGGALLFAHNEISGNGRPGTEVTVSIPQGSGVSVIAQKLKDAGVIRSAICSAGMWGKRVRHQSCSMAILPCRRAPVLTMPLLRSCPLTPSRNGARDHPRGHHGHCHCPEDGSRRAVQRRGFPEGSQRGRFQRIHLLAVRAGRCRRAGPLYEVRGYLFPETYEFLKDDTVHNYVATFYAQFDAQFTAEMYAALKKTGV